MSLPCGCSGENRPALEHSPNCPRRLSFFGGDSAWGIGKDGDTRVRSDGEIFEWNQITWRYTGKNIKKIRKEKLLKIKHDLEK